jgi:uncharacterized membrane protein
MNDLSLVLKLVHIIGSAVLFGTGLGIAFFMLMAHRTRNPAVIAHTAGIVVIADAVFTATAVVVQPITGMVMAWMAGYSTGQLWISVSIALYLFVGLCWLPVVWIQLQLRKLAAQAGHESGVLPERYFKLFRIWFWLGWPAFAGVIAIFALMIWKPV